LAAAIFARNFSRLRTDFVRKAPGTLHPMSKSIDKFDVALLNLVQSNSAATADALAREVPLSPSAITRRLRRLRDEGLIAAEVAILSPRLVEDRLWAMVQVQAHDHAENKGMASLRSRLAALEEVQLLLDVGGSFDLALLVVTRNMAAFNAFAERFVAADPVVRRYETSFVKRVVKNRPAVRLDEGDCAR
jgi:Lrp/AsnC family leucine-responsive transcriptional regulator